MLTSYDIEKIHQRLREIHNIVVGDDKHYGFYQLCPMCNGEGELIGDYWDGTAYNNVRACPVCNGAKLLVRPEIKTT